MIEHSMINLEIFHNTEVEEIMKENFVICEVCFYLIDILLTSHL